MGMLLSRSPKGDDLVTRREPRKKGMECGDGGGCLVSQGIMCRTK